MRRSGRLVLKDAEKLKKKLRKTARDYLNASRTSQTNQSARGENGRRKGLKIPRSKGRAGSNPAARTKYFKLKELLSKPAVWDEVHANKVEKDYNYIMADWDAVERLMHAMGLKNFLICVTRVAKAKGMLKHEKPCGDPLTS